ncbi:hypothetical protein KM043_012120 [Ampulex compressa]|nr:hypothetical protein KM043_012120 [Ampulex compressa]
MGGHKEEKLSNSFSLLLAPSPGKSLMAAPKIVRRVHLRRARAPGNSWPTSNLRVGRFSTWREESGRSARSSGLAAIQVETQEGSQVEESRVKGTSGTPRWSAAQKGPWGSG